MLTDEEIEKIEGKLGWPSPAKFGRAVIAAHEAKRMPPEEWLAEAKELINAYAYRQRVASYNSATQEDKDEADQCYEALIAHISTPPAGMVPVPEEPTERMRIAGFECDAWDELGNAVLARKGWPYSCKESAQCVSGIYKAMIAAAKEQK